jgi:hypothetical protein
VVQGQFLLKGLVKHLTSMKPFWANRNAETEKPVRGPLAKGDDSFNTRTASKTQAT